MYSNWEPKAFDARALDGSNEGQAGKEELLTSSRQQQDQPGAEGGSYQQLENIQEETRAGFVYDQASGYWYDAASGYYYDANTSLYYHRSTNVWYSYDHATGQYAAVGGGEDSSANATVDKPEGSTASMSQGGAGTASAVTAVATSGTSRQTSLAVAAKPTKTGVTKRAGAIIGAAPVLNAQGLLAAAALAEVGVTVIEGVCNTVAEAPYCRMLTYCLACLSVLCHKR